MHSWVEVWVNEQWYFLEGVILDKPYLTKLQEQNSDCKTTFCGFGVYTDNFENPPIEWNLNKTFIQDKGINRDFGVFDTPDLFYAKHQQELNAFKKFIFQHIVRHIMNNNVERIRNKKCNEPKKLKAMINTDKNHKHTYDAQGKMTCCTQEEKIYTKAGAKELVKGITKMTGHNTTTAMMTDTTIRIQEIPTMFSRCFFPPLFPLCCCLQVSQWIIGFRRRGLPIG